jgi:hypothetical protein
MDYQLAGCHPLVNPTISTAPSCPATAADISAVRACGVSKSTTAECFSSSSMTATWPSRAASCSRVVAAHVALKASRVETRRLRAMGQLTST